MNRWITGCAMFGLFAVPAIGQDAEPQAAAAAEVFEFALPNAAQDMPADMKKKAIEQAKKTQEKNLTKRLGLRISELKKVCDLSDSQVRRLQLAAKGAVKNELKGFEEKIKKMQQQMMNGFVVEDAEVGIVAQAANAALEAIGLKNGDEKKEASSNTDAESEDKEVRQFRKEMAMMYGPMEMMLSGGGTAAIEQQKLWKVQVRKTLNDEQWIRHQRLMKSRRAYKRRAQVMSVVAGYDATLLMTDEQREQMTKLVDEELGKFLEAVPEGQAAYMLESLEDFDVTRRAYRRMRKASKEFLTEQQFAEFKQRPQDQWEQFGMLWGMMEGGMAIAAPVEAAMVEVPEDAGYLGVQLAEEEDGVLLRSVSEGLAADKAGLEAGDIVKAVDGKEVGSLSELIKTIGETKPDQTVKLSIVRDGKASDVEVTLGSRNAVPPK